jgi:TonB family protein
MQFLKLLLVLAFCSSLTAQAQSTLSNLKVRLIRQPLYLRGFWGGNTLHFDSTGQLIGPSPRRSFTLCGMDVKKIDLKDDSLILEGDRVGLEFNRSTPARVVLPDERLRIEISRPSDGDYGLALTTIFTNGLDELTPYLPSYWQDYASKFFVSSGSQVSTTPSISSAGQAKQIGGNVKPPVLLKAAQPAFSNAARALIYNGSVLVGLTIDESGKPSHLYVIKPAGLGLDEQALYAVEHYVFKPATENGSPVRVQLKVKVDFQIH